jgi:hypothetical protein
MSRRHQRELMTVSILAEPAIRGATGSCRRVQKLTTRSATPAPQGCSTSGCSDEGGPILGAKGAARTPIDDVARPAGAEHAATNDGDALSWYAA